MSGVLQLGRLVLASHNPDKIAELREFLSPLRLDCLSAAELGLASPEETGASFAANARLKAEAAAQASGLPALADDSGLCVDALDGAPGVRSARWAVRPREDEPDFLFGMQKIERALMRRGVRARRAPNPQSPSACFVCALALAWPPAGRAPHATERGGRVRVFEGRARGCLIFPPRGELGFGYDPIFVPHGSVISFGEMVATHKNRISHRADAFRQLHQWAGLEVRPHV